MTKSEFQKKYHNFHTKSENRALAEAFIVNAQGIENDKAVVVNFKHLGYCLMLKSAFEALKRASF